MNKYGYNILFILSVLMYSRCEFKRLRDKQRFKGHPKSLSHGRVKKYKPDRNLLKTIGETLKIQ